MHDDVVTAGPLADQDAQGGQRNIGFVVSRHRRLKLEKVGAGQRAEGQL